MPHVKNSEICHAFFSPPPCSNSSGTAQGDGVEADSDLGSRRSFPDFKEEVLRQSRAVAACPDAAETMNFLEDIQDLGDEP